MTTGHEIIEVLEQYAELEWYKFKKLDSEDQWKYPPAVVFRFSSSVSESPVTEKLMSIFQSVVSGFTGGVEWLLLFPRGRNWVLIPKRLWDLEHSGEFRVDVEAKIHLAEQDPQFGISANQDLPTLAAQLSNALGAAGVPRKP